MSLEYKHSATLYLYGGSVAKANVDRAVLDLIRRVVLEEAEKLGVRVEGITL